MSEVFISYRQINDAQRQRVRDFAGRLRDCGIKVVLDQFYKDDNAGGPPDGWPKWSSDQARDAARVLIIGDKPWFRCFDGIEKPGTGLGAACEAGSLRQRLYDASGRNEIARVVYFDDADIAHISHDLKRYDRFHAVRDFISIVKWLGGVIPDSDNLVGDESQLGHKAVILGKGCDVSGYDEQGRLILGSGERFEITPLGIDPRTFRSYTLRSVSRLTFTGGQWMVDGSPLETYWACQFASPRNSESDTNVFTAMTLRDVLDEGRRESMSKDYPLPSELQKMATAVAWVEERFQDYPGQTRDPSESPLRVEFGGR